MQRNTLGQPAQETTRPSPIRRGIAPVLAFSAMSVAVMQTLLVPVIKDLPTLLDTTPGNAAWVMTATLLAAAIATPIMGRLGDLYGKRRTLLISLAVMAAGSLIGAFTDNLMIMIVGRALQGFGLGAVPPALGLMRDVLPAHKVRPAMALLSSAVGVGGGLALPAAALIAQNADWHALFLCSALMAALALLLIYLVVPESPLRAMGRFDAIGAAGLSLGLVSLLLPLTKGSTWGWTSPTTLGLFAAAVVILLLWGLFELRHTAPLVDLRTTARRPVLLANLATISVGFVWYVVTLALPQLLQIPASTGYGPGQSMVMAGVLVAPLGLTMMATTPLYSRLAARYGPKATMVLGMLIIAIGYTAGLFLMSAAWQAVVITVVLGLGSGLAFSSTPALITGAVDPSETSAANGLNNLMRSIGSSSSSAVVGMVLANATTRTGSVEAPTLDGFRTAFLIAILAALAGLALAAFLPSQRSTRQTQPDNVEAVPAAAEPRPIQR
ncbi:MFS transporter [Streptomyces sp. NPDC048305]|uniref:MFS transporter n=1 Tax=Streptomyces sp. NPDC048305 TaxID=3365532 RepID=UPI00372111EC